MYVAGTSSEDKRSPSVRIAISNPLEGHSDIEEKPLVCVAKQDSTTRPPALQPQRQAVRHVNVDGNTLSNQDGAIVLANHAPETRRRWHHARGRDSSNTVRQKVLPSRPPSLVKVDEIYYIFFSAEE
ncbi:MAG: hypothetical protein M1837_006679 [Sclerophora amabilis]|nr:MAG: hypothetical protein M1837_006679 [Sclerophora amabilis]